MSGSDLAWRWSQSRVVARGLSPRALKHRLGFVREAARVRSALAPLRAPAPGSALQRALAERPELLGAVVWPYVCAGWDAEARLRHLAAHFQAVGRAAVLQVPAGGAVELLDLSDVSPGLRVVLDQPKWFMREGPLVLNLFEGELRLYSLAFSLAGTPPVAYVGALQGVATEGVLERYRELTKALHGLRPRDVLIELFRMLSRALGVTRILAVADAARVHRSAYFGGAKAAQLQVDYDAIWADRGGVPHDPQFFTLPLHAPAKSLDEVPSKKRAMYRRRHELLAALEQRLAAACALPGGAPLTPPAGAPAAGFDPVAQHA